MVLKFDARGEGQVADGRIERCRHRGKAAAIQWVVAGRD